MKPKPFSALNHFTVPCATCAPTLVRADGPSDAAEPGYSLFRPRTRTWNSNRARGYSTGCVERATPRTFQTGQVRTGTGVWDHPTPGRRSSPDEARSPDRPQRGLHPVGGADDGQQRVEGLQPLAGVEDDGLPGRVQQSVLDQ